jgi:hypothetical protein
MVTRLIADSLPSEPQIAMAAGAMMVGDKFVGTMTGMDCCSWRGWVGKRFARLGA